MSQFKLTTVLGPIGESVNFSQANLLMAVGGLLTLALLYFGMRPRAVVPGRLQAMAELSYKFIHDMCVDQVGEEGKRYFPFVFTLFFFVLMGNLIGLVPWSFTYTSHIAVTLSLAALVVVTTTVIALKRHGLHFFSYFYPEGTPIYLAPLIVPIEVISYLSRLVSLSVRLFANMVAGHVVLKVFASFVVALGSLGVIGQVAALGPLALSIVMVAFELLVAFLQAYVFAILTTIYLHDAVHLH